MGWAPLRSVRDGTLEAHRRAGARALRPDRRPRRAHRTVSPRSRPRRAPCAASSRRLARSADRVSAGADERRCPAAASALGYVSAGASRAGGATAPDPKRMVALFEQLLEGNRALARRPGGEAARIARERAGRRRRQRVRPSGARPGAAGDRAASRGHRRRCAPISPPCPAAPTPIIGSRWRSCVSATAYGRWPRKRRRSPSTRGTAPRCRLARRAALLGGPEGRGRAVAARRRSRPIRRNMRCAWRWPICSPTPAGPPTPKPSTAACSRRGPPMSPPGSGLGVAAGAHRTARAGDRRADPRARTGPARTKPASNAPSSTSVWVAPPRPVPASSGSTTRRPGRTSARRPGERCATGREVNVRSDRRRGAGVRGQTPFWLGPDRCEATALAGQPDGV